MHCFVLVHSVQSWTLCLLSFPNSREWIMFPTITQIFITQQYATPTRECDNLLLTTSPYTFPLMLMFTKDCQYNLINIKHHFLSSVKNLLRILWCSQSDDHPQNSLSKFGYICESRKKEEGWLPTGTYHQNPEVWKRKRKSGKFGSFFSMKNPLYRSKSYFSSQILQKFTSRRNSGIHISTLTL